MDKQEIDYKSAEYKLNTRIINEKEWVLPLEILNIRCVEQKTERMNQTFTPYMHQHACFEMHMPIAGWQTYQFAEGDISVCAEEVVLIPPNTLHSILKSSDDLKKFTMKFILNFSEMADSNIENSYFSQVIQKLHTRQYMKTKADSWYPEVMKRVFQEAYEERYGWTALVYNMISQLIVEIASENLIKEKKGSLNERLRSRRIKSIESFLQDNISAMITKQMVAEQMFLSVRQLDRIVLAERGVTLKGMIDQIKMQEARRLLRETNMTQQEISISLGFSDPSSFSRFFRKFEAVSPGIYKKRIQKDEEKGEEDSYE